MAVGTNGWGVWVVVWSQYRPQSLRWSVVEVLSFFPNTILAGIGQSSFYTPLTWPFISYEEVSTYGPSLCALGGNVLVKV
jgi:hypothetical protein